MTCDRCEHSAETGMTFCPYCGERLKESRGVLERIAIWITPFVLIFLICETIYLVGGIGTVWDWASTQSMQILGLVPTLVVLGTIEGIALQIAWILIAATIIVSLTTILWQSFKSFRPKDSMEERIANTPLCTIGMVFGATIALNLIINGIQILAGHGIVSPDDLPMGNEPNALLDYADAAVWEEVIARFVPIGVPMAIAALVLRKKDFWRYLLGGFGFSKLAMVLLIVSALMFGFAHMSGWGFEKVIPTFASGLFIGYLYIRVGIHASITVHFLTDYLAVVGDTGAVLIVGLCILAILALGFVSLVNYLLSLKDVRKRIDRMQNWVPDDDERALPTLGGLFRLD